MKIRQLLAYTNTGGDGDGLMEIVMRHDGDGDALMEFVLL